MNIARTIILFTALCGASAGIGALATTIYIGHDIAPAQIVQPKIDEASIADLVAAKIIADRDARLAAEKAKHRKADCAFWGKRMEGCS